MLIKKKRNEKRGVIFISQDEMKDLTESMDDKLVKGLRNKIAAYETELYDLKATMTKKDEEIKKLVDKDSNLDSELEQGKAKITELENQVKELSSSKESISSEVGDLKSQIEALNKKIGDLNNSLSEKDSKLEELTKAISESEKIIEEQKASLTKAEGELVELKPAAPTEYSSEDRLICPSCGAVGKDIKSEEDKSKILGYIGHSPMYSKINVCKKCGQNF